MSGRTARILTMASSPLSGVPAAPPLLRNLPRPPPADKSGPYNRA